MKLLSPAWFLLVMLLMHCNVSGAENCIDEICIGDDVELLNVEWKPINLTYQDERFARQELEGRTVTDVFYDYFEVMVADQQVLTTLLPYVIRTQRFDQRVLDELKKVDAICSSLTLTGEVQSDLPSKLFVTFRAVPNSGNRGTLRVVRLEKQYDILPPHMRQSDRKRYNMLKEDLQQQYPNFQVVRDIDARNVSSISQTTNALLGFRFISTVFNPLIFRLIDTADITPMEDSDQASPICPAQE